MNTEFQQNRVSQAIWPWPAGKRPGAPTHPSLLFSLITLGVGLVVAGLFFFFHHSRMALLVTAISLTVFLCSRFSPTLYHRMEKILQGLSRLVGQALTWLLLVPFFYLFFSFGHLIQRLSGKDPMARSWEKGADSYWQNRPPESDPDQYRRQF